jgi:BMFP domain-containing protein YqiC
MQTDNRLLDDLARMANGALATFSGLREEIETRVRERVERMLTDMDMVPREEFDAVKAVAQQARAEQEELSAKVARLETQLAALQTAATKRRKAAANKGTSAPAKGATPARAKGTTPRRRTAKGAAASS